MESCHPREIELGLERVRAVQARLGLTTAPFAVITVGGTNGKGSTVAFAENMLRAGGYRVGAYFSPHVFRYNERVRIDGAEVSDAALCEAFAQVDAARGETSLTYFEFGTLAAMALFRAANVEIAVLEVGLGGRLDAVNAWDADVAVLTAIGLDHMDWLGPDRESIGGEKAGIFRAKRPAVCGDANPPQTVHAAATALAVPLHIYNRDFFAEQQPGGWRWRCPVLNETWHALPPPAMRGAYQYQNAATALMALALLRDRFPLDRNAVRAALTQTVLTARFQALPGRPLTIVDVAHNGQAAEALALDLQAHSVPGRTLAVVGMLKDKPIEAVLAIMSPAVDEFFFGDLTGTRAASAAQLAGALAAVDAQKSCHVHADMVGAYRAARTTAAPHDRIVVFGSFLTVSAILAAADKAGGVDAR